jgi:hypothetical protein
MVSALDIFPTSIASVDPKIKIKRAIDGVNLLPYLMDSLEQDPHDYLFWQRGISKVVRSDKWKFMMNEYNGKHLLFNLSENKYENPDELANYPIIVQELKQAHYNWRQTHTEPLWPPVVYFTVEKDGHTVYFEQ